MDTFSYVSQNGKIKRIPKMELTATLRSTTPNPYFADRNANRLEPGKKPPEVVLVGFELSIGRAGGVAALLTGIS